MLWPCECLPEDEAVLPIARKYERDKIIWTKLERTKETKYSRNYCKLSLPTVGEKDQGVTVM